MSDTVKRLEEIFAQNKDKRICVLGTTCCGKTTLQKELSEAIDMDEALWPTLSRQEEAYICQKPWTNEIGTFTRALVKERIKIEPSHPLFSLIVLECDLIVYLNISEELLKAHCKKRNASFQDAIKIKLAIEQSMKAYAEKAHVDVIEMTMQQ